MRLIKKEKLIIILITFLFLFISFVLGIYYSSHILVSSQSYDYLFEALSIVLTEKKFGFNGYQGNENILIYLKEFSTIVVQKKNKFWYLIA